MENVRFDNVNELISFADGLFYGEESFWNKSGRALVVGVGCYLFDRAADVSPETIVSPVTIRQCLSPLPKLGVRIDSILGVKNLPDETRGNLTGLLANGEKVQASVYASVLQALHSL